MPKVQTQNQQQKDFLDIWKDRHSNLDRDNANDQISAIYDDINNYSNRYDNLSDQQKSGLTRDEYIYIKHHDGTNVTKFGMNESLGRRIYNNSLTNADPKDLSAFGYIDEIYDLGRNREYSYSWGENSDYGNWLHTINRDGIFYQYDPLALDLNGNGIEPLAADGHAGAMFDHERNGIRTATGWVHSNDGILVYDRNGDGKINNGGELFGDNTLLKDGSTAAHGFAALAELDENSDGKVDAADSAFKKLGVWRDLNHNGISEEGEISSLEDVRVQSLNLAYKNADQNLGNGNTLAEVGSYTDADGNEHIMGDLQLSADRFHSRFSDSIELTDAQRREVNLGGSGRVRNLREAAAQSSELADALQQYKNAETKEEQLALRDKLLQAWANTDKSRDSIIKISADFAIHTQQDRRRGIGLTPSQIRHMQSIMSRNIWELIGESDPDGKRQAELYRRIGVLDSFTGTRSSRLYYFNEAQAKHIIDTVNGTYDKLADSLYDGLLFQTRLRPYLDAMRLRISEEGKYSIDYGDVSALFAEIHKKNPGKAFTDLGELLAKGNADGKNTDMAPLAEKFVQYAQEADNNGSFEAYSKVLGEKNMLALGYTLAPHGDSLGEKILGAIGYNIGKDGDDALYGNSNANYLHGGNGNDMLEGHAGDDTLNGGAGNDVLFGNIGHDTLDGGTGDDYMEGGNFESDTYIFRVGHGKDAIKDLAWPDQADTLRFEGALAEKAQFGREGNNLVIQAYGSNDQVSLVDYFYGEGFSQYHFQFDDATWGREDMFKKTFTFGGTENNEGLGGWISDDIIHGKGGDDDIRGYEGNDALYGDAGNDALHGDGGDDTLDGGEGNDFLEGNQGNDTLNGGAGNDALYGHEGKDTLDGGTGDDYMEGGNFESDTYIFRVGHGKDAIKDLAWPDQADTLRFEGALAEKAQFGREGNNLVIQAYGSNDQVSLVDYFYGEGFSQYHFQFDDATWGREDMFKKTFTFGGTENNEGLGGWISDDIIHGKGGDDDIRGYEGNDALYGDAGNDALHGDGGDDTLDGGEGNDFLEGNQGNDTLNGGAGNDALYGHEGKDTLDGGTGDDYMEGGNFESDTYIFRVGHGKDAIKDLAWPDQADTLRFEGALAEKAQFGREGNNLVIQAYGSNDQVSLVDYFYGEGFSQYHFQFDDATWGREDMFKKTFTFGGTENNEGLGGWISDDIIHGKGGDDDIRGYEGNDALYGDAGNDALHGDGGDDTLDGGEGNDFLEGNQGNDTLNGGAGNDALYGHEGKDTLDGGTGDDYMEGGNFESDTYIFRVGHGKDTIRELAVWDAQADTLRFEGAQAEKARFSREGRDLVVKAYGGDDQVTLKDYFYGEGFARYDFHFDDATFKAAELRGIDLPTQGLKAPAEATTAAADTQTHTTAPAEENAQPENSVPPATADDGKQAETNAQKPIVVVDRARPAPQKVMVETAGNTPQANADADIASGESTTAADTPANIAAAETAQSTGSGATDSAAKNAATTEKPATTLAPVATSTKIQPVTVAADTQQTPAATASASGDSPATASQKASPATAQQNATAVADALKTGGTTAAAASALDANAARQSQQMLSAMAAQGQTASPTALAAPDLQPKPQLVASQV